MVALRAIIGLAAIALYVHQDGTHPCNDGERYTSGKPQPKPFSRRFCAWNPFALMALNAVALLTVCMALPSPQAALIFVTLPGVWFLVTRPTCVDLLAMGLAVVASVAFTRGHPAIAIAVALAAGFVHERAPVMAAIYVWSPWLLIGLAASGWWRKPAAKDHELVGMGIRETVDAHRQYQDFLDPKSYALPLAGPMALAVSQGTTPAGWVAVAISHASRIVGSDLSRFLVWAAPPILMHAPTIPWWVVALNVLAFRRIA